MWETDRGASDNTQVWFECWAFGPPPRGTGNLVTARRAMSGRQKGLSFLPTASRMRVQARKHRGWVARLRRSARLVPASRPTVLRWYGSFEAGWVAIPGEGCSAHGVSLARFSLVCGLAAYRETLDGVS